MPRALALVTAAIAALAAPMVATSVAAQGWKAPRTGFGQPDLGGVWTNATITPLERDARFGDRLVLMPEEARAMESGNWARVQKAQEATKDGTKPDELPSCGGGQTGPAWGHNHSGVA